MLSDDKSIDEAYEKYLEKLDSEIKRFNQLISDEGEKHLENICKLRAEAFGTTVEYEWNTIVGYRKPRPIGGERKQYLQEARQRARDWAKQYFPVGLKRKARK